MFKPFPHKGINAPITLSKNFYSLMRDLSSEWTFVKKKNKFYVSIFFILSAIRHIKQAHFRKLIKCFGKCISTLLRVHFGFSFLITQQKNNRLF